MGLAWVVVAIGAMLVFGWVLYYARTTWIPERREKRRQQEVLARGRRLG